nr:DUF3618 domain-containing protein [uncultured Friedmanniella sp.]
MSNPIVQPGPGRDPSAEQIAADIAQTRARLAGNVDALADKLDVKARAQEKVDDVKVTARAKVDDVKATAQAAAAEGKDKVVAGSRQVGDRYQGLSRPVQIAVAVAPVVLMVVLVIRRIRS